MLEDKDKTPEELRKFFNAKDEKQDEDSEELNKFLADKKEKDEQERDNVLISKVFTGGLQGLVTSVMNSVAGLFKDLAPIDKRLLKLFFNFCEKRKLIPTRIIESLLEYFMEEYGNSIRFADDKIYDEDGTLWIPEDVKNADEENEKPEPRKPFRINGLSKREVGKNDSEVKKDEEKDTDFIWSSDS